MNDITITLGDRPIPDAEERKQRALRAQEVLSGAGWLFETVLTTLTKDLLETDPHERDKREELYQQLRANTELTALLRQIINQQKAEDLTNERRISKQPPADHE